MIDRDLLRQAWPMGYLDTRGVKTLGGWQCLGPPFPAAATRLWSTPGWKAVIAVAPGEEPEYDGFPTAVREGDLLPAIHPADVATWAAVKADLAKALDWPDELELLWSYEVAEGANPHLFVLQGLQGRPMASLHSSRGFNLEHPALTAAWDRPAAEGLMAVGLVVARIMARKETGR